MQRALLAALAAALCPSCGRTTDAPPHVLLVTLDTTRVDRLGVYGHRGGTSPALDALAARSVVFDEVRSTSSWTLPAHASLFTGLWPHEHGVRYDAAGPLALEDAIAAGSRTYADLPYRVRGLAADTPVLAERLRAVGYRTAAVVAGPWLMRPFGMDRGFEHYDDRDITSDAGRRANRVTDAAIDWLGRREPGRPFFLFLNYFDPHEPYAAPGHPEGGDPLAAYEGEIAFMDRELGRLLEHLEEEGLLERTLIVVTGDHGELLGERDRWGHGRWLDEPLLRVPLIVKLPGQEAGRRASVPLQLPHVQELVLEGIEGGALDLVRAAEELAGSRPIHLAEVWPSPDHPELGRWVTVVEGTHKLLFSPTSGRRVLFDLATDPDERVDVSDRYPEVVERLGGILRELEASPGGRSIPVEGEALEALRSLGYLGR